MSDTIETIMSGTMPILALRGLTVFPNQTIHFDVGREKSVRALDAAMKDNQTLFLVPQKSVLDDDPAPKDLYPVGTVVMVKQILRAQGENLRVLVTGLARAKIAELRQEMPYLEGVIEQVQEKACPDSLRIRALRRDANVLFGTYLDKAEHPAQALQLRLVSTDDTGYLADSIIQNAHFDYREKAKLLGQLSPAKRLEEAVKLLRQELQMMDLESEIQEKTKAEIDQDQRDYYLREQMKIIRNELGEDDENNEAARYSKKIKALKLPQDSEEKLLKDVERMQKQPFGSSEGAVLRSYLDTVLELPWNTTTKERVDVAAARKILDHDHFGLQKVKERILESLAVRQLAPSMPPQIICLVGPPGVGKTSIAYSIARSLNRKMARISLGGVHDEADIRGHRKTYVGAMPGRIMTALTQAGSRNALILLDEVDKMGSDYRGDPSAALLEVLDAEQNTTYRDHYVEIPFDLHDVMFITTANTLDTVPRPLLDRMEIIELGSYTDEEKLMIAKEHLLPKQLKKHGLLKSQLHVGDNVLREIIRCYTRESGVRTLERRLAEICRKTAMHRLKIREEFKQRAGDAPEGSGLTVEEWEKKAKVTVTTSNIETYLGVRKYLPDQIPTRDEIGLVTGLAWTSVGGETLEVEVNVMEGSGKLELTGNLGDVMKESAHAALCFIRANAQKLGVASDFYKTKDIHVHFPEGAVPKDGPSAGVTVCTAMVSALTGTPVRHDVAMTGEISIRGRVMAIGGLKEKTMAALRHGMKTVIIPLENRRDLEEIDQTVRNKLTFVTAETAEQVLETALVKQPELLPGLQIPEEMRRNADRPGIRQ